MLESFTEVGLSAMAGKKGQRNPSKHKRENQYSTGLVEPVREPKTIAFRPLKGLGELIEADIQARGLTKQQWCDEAVACMLGDAIRVAIAEKSTAIANEKRSKNPDENLIQRLESEVKSLEGLVGDQ